VKANCTVLMLLVLRMQLIAGFYFFLASSVDYVDTRTASAVALQAAAVRNFTNWRCPVCGFATSLAMLNLLEIYTVVHKKQDTFIFLITLANIDGFS